MRFLQIYAKIQLFFFFFFYVIMIECNTMHKEMEEYE